MSTEKILSSYHRCLETISQEPFPIGESDKILAVFSTSLSDLQLAISQLELESDTSSERVFSGLSPECLEYSTCLQNTSQEDLLSALAKASQFVLTFFVTLQSRHRHDFFQLSSDTLVSVPENTKALFHLMASGNTLTDHELVGKGSYGKVHRVTLKNLNMVRKKLLEEASKDKVGLLAVQRELCVYSGLSHRNIVKMVGCFASDKVFDLYLGHVNGGRLHDFLEKAPKIDSFLQIDPSIRIDISLQIAMGVAYLHSKKFIHRDLTTANILLQHSEENLTIKICDFGLTSDINFNSSNMLHANFSAPESFSSMHNSTALDVYSIGVLIFLMFHSNKLPYPKKYEAEKWEEDAWYRYRLYQDYYLNRTITTYPVPEGTHWDKEDPDQSLRTPMARCLASKPHLRPTAEELVEILTALKLSQAAKT